MGAGGFEFTACAAKFSIKVASNFDGCFLVLPHQIALRPNVIYFTPCKTLLERKRV